MNVNLTFDTVEKVLHIADVHIRNYNRHKEYRQVFKNYIKQLKNYLQIV